MSLAVTKGRRDMTEPIAILFAADAGWPLCCPEPEQAELADILASAVGHPGTMAVSLLNTVTELDLAGIHDPYLRTFQALVAERQERLPAADVRA